MTVGSRRLAVLLLILAFSAVGVIGIAAQEDHPHWTYEGEEGPDRWGALDEEWAVCAEGHAQSPIDVRDAAGLNLVDIAFDYHESAMNIFNNGHTIQVNYDPGSSITYNEDRYDLLQFHFHHPSEHLVDGEPADMEIHFVHRDAAGNLAVVGAMMVAGEATNEAYTPIFQNLPAEAGDPEASDVMLNANDLLPEVAGYYTYRGSLTTPPCTEGVRWLLLNTPVTVSQTDIDAFSALFENNARPVQPLNLRDLLEDTNG